MQVAESFVVASDKSDQNVAGIPDFSLHYVDDCSGGEPRLFFGAAKARP